MDQSVFDPFHLEFTMAGYGRIEPYRQNHHQISWGENDTVPWDTSRQVRVGKCALSCLETSISLRYVVKTVPVRKTPG
jgi:hypothetical protein